MNFSPTGWTKVVAGTLAGTLFCITVALYVDSFNFINLSPQALRRAILINIFVPLCLAAPLLFLLLYKMRQLAIAHHEMSILASTDSLTAVLSRGAFTLLVDAYLDKVRRRSEQRAGALLVIDADHFKRVNDEFGHQHGDHALKIVASSITAALRDGAIVGRIGGEEFAVFLPGASPAQAAVAAERIRKSVEMSVFRPSGANWPLSVSIGGVAFEQRSSYDTLYVAADKQLYRAKAAGRNRVKIGRLNHADNSNELLAASTA